MLGIRSHERKITLNRLPRRVNRFNIERYFFARLVSGFIGSDFNIDLLLLFFNENEPFASGFTFGLKRVSCKMPSSGMSWRGTLTNILFLLLGILAVKQVIPRC